MEIWEVKENKRDYMELLLLADEQESMIEQYLDRGRMFVLGREKARAVCVVTEEDLCTLEIKNIAVCPEYQKQGLGKRMIDFVVETFRGQYEELLVGTGESPLTVPFYEKCGFRISHRIPNFFTDYYDHPIYECGEQLVDMVYLKRLFL
ncbi:GNAT family N-acetyltransferase [Candidatus Merdisoma sp. JLR.KK006]|uniref:GNAT family N-acetyltransferase n=1 Tax=Candidatus Merdisoma sp. JLR.KK006 TaxID=3112626 RepID=UPI002FF038FB